MNGGEIAGLSTDMPAFKDKLSSAEIRGLVAYLRELED
jgi:mono/diheme cytochrome c family protein